MRQISFHNRRLHCVPCWLKGTVRFACSLQKPTKHGVWRTGNTSSSLKNHCSDSIMLMGDCVCGVNQWWCYGPSLPSRGNGGSITNSLEGDYMGFPGHLVTIKTSITSTSNVNVLANCIYTFMSGLSLYTRMPSFSRTMLHLIGSHWWLVGWQSWMAQGSELVKGYQAQCNKLSHRTSCPCVKITNGDQLAPCAFSEYTILVSHQSNGEHMGQTGEVCLSPATPTCICGCTSPATPGSMDAILPSHFKQLNEFFSWHLAAAVHARGGFTCYYVGVCNNLKFLPKCHPVHCRDISSPYR